MFALEGQDDLLLIVRRVEALGKFLDTEDGKNLLAGYKRAANIIRIEEKKDNREYTGAPEPAALQTGRRKSTGSGDRARPKREAERAVGREDFEAAMRAMAKLRPYVDAFFDKVTVNVDDKALRENRLKLLNEIRAATRAVADFSKIEGLTSFPGRGPKAREPGIHSHKRWGYAIPGLLASLGPGMTNSQWRGKC